MGSTGGGGDGLIDWHACPDEKLELFTFTSD